MKIGDRVRDSHNYTGTVIEVVGKSVVVVKWDVLERNYFNSNRDPGGIAEFVHELFPL